MLVALPVSLVALGITALVGYRNLVGLGRFHPQVSVRIALHAPPDLTLKKSDPPFVSSVKLDIPVQVSCTHVYFHFADGVC